MNESARVQRDVWAGLATGYGFALVLVPIVTLEDGAATREVVTTIAAVAIASLVGLLFLRRSGGRASVWAGPLLVSVGSLMYSVTPAGLATAIIALLVGAGAGLCAGGLPVPGPRWTHAAGVVAGAATIAAAWMLGGDDTAALVVAVLMSMVAVGVRVFATGRPVATRSRPWLVGLALFGATALVVWTGMNDPQLSWFGPVSANGPRNLRQVAITFDDGPNDPFSLDIARILDDHGAKGTFFEVGKALDAEPDVARRLMDDGHLLGNHSYHHDYWRWLDPRYLELDRTQESFERNLGVCPRFFRPPHGQRTPFMNLQIAAKDMVTVTWDVSGADWDTTDGGLVAARILRRVQPGSIILLHDSLDGDVGASRQVVIEALPIILEGLREKGLEPVRVDEMLGGPAYLDC